MEEIADSISVVNKKKSRNFPESSLYLNAVLYIYPPVQLFLLISFSKSSQSLPSPPLLSFQIPCPSPSLTPLIHQQNSRKCQILSMATALGGIME